MGEDVAIGSSNEASSSVELRLPVSGLESANDVSVAFNGTDLTGGELIGDSLVLASPPNLLERPSNSIQLSQLDTGPRAISRNELQLWIKPSA